MSRGPIRNLVLPLSLALSSGTVRAKDLIFEYTAFGSGFGQSQFNVLNYAGINGRYMNTSGDAHRPEMLANNNDLAGFYNFLTDRYSAHTVKDGNLSADEIHQYFVNNAGNNGPVPKWLVLNEISSSLWSANPGAPSASTYRTWLIDCVTRLHEHYGYEVVTLAPFQNPGQSNASWQALSAVSYIGIECYLSGTEVWNAGADEASRLAWAKGQYQASKNSYLARGVPAERLFLTEHFANNDATYVDVNGNTQISRWGRAGLASADDWDTVLKIRQDAILSVGFDGFLAYNWGGNGMGVSLAEQLRHEYVYRSRRVLASQQPQWLSDSAITVEGTTIPPSWAEPLNWLGGVPNAPGAIANFFRTNTAARTITLDAPRTVGTLTFDSPSSFTLSAGTGSGAITFDNGANTANLGVSQGSHTISANVRLQTNTTATIDNGSLTISGNLTGPASLTKSGTGTLTLASTNNDFTGNVILTAGTFAIPSDSSLGAVPAAFRANAIVFSGGTLRNIGSSAISIAANRGITVLPAGGTLDLSSSLGVPALNSKITGTGTLTKNGIKTLLVNSDSSASFSGNWLVKQGRLNVQPSGSRNALGTGTITLAPSNGDVAQLGIGATTGGISVELINSIHLAPTGNGQISFEINANNMLTLSGPISGSATLQKSGGSASGTQGGSPLVTPGTLVLSGHNTFTGPTTLHAGVLRAAAPFPSQSLGSTSSVTLHAGTTLRLDTPDQVSDTAPIKLHPGATLDTGSNNDSLGPLALSITTGLNSPAILDLGSVSSSTLAFAASNGVTWPTGTTLHIYNYTPFSDHLFFGNTASSLTSSQLSKIAFFSDSGRTPLGTSSPVLRPTGELVPTPIPEPVSLALFCFTPLLRSRRVSRG